jgi:hypothetical protein
MAKTNSNLNPVERAVLNLNQRLGFTHHQKPYNPFFKFDKYTRV